MIRIFNRDFPFYMFFAISNTFLRYLPAFLSRLNVFINALHEYDTSPSVSSEILHEMDLILNKSRGKGISDTPKRMPATYQTGYNPCLRRHTDLCVRHQE